MNQVVRDTCQHFNNNVETIDRWISQTTFTRAPLQPFESDLVDGKVPFYYQQFTEIFNDDIKRFCKAVRCNMALTKLWMVKYNKGDWHPPHTHGAIGYSGIIVVKCDPTHHRGPMYINDPVNPITGWTNYIGGQFGIQPGTVYIARSDMLHFTYPNPIDVPRIVLGFDLRPIADHDSEEIS